MKIKRGFILHLIRRIEALPKRRKVVLGLISFIMILLIGFSLWGITTGFFSSLAAPPQVSNVAAVNYQDLAGNSYSAQSNVISSDLIVQSANDTQVDNDSTDAVDTVGTDNSSESSTPISNSDTNTAPTESSGDSPSQVSTGEQVSLPATNLESAESTESNLEVKKESSKSFYENLGLQPWTFWLLFGCLALLVIGLIIFYVVKRKKGSNYLGVFLIFALLLTSFWPISSLDTALANDLVTFYISPSGNDNNTGTLAAPFASLEKARETVKTTKQNMGINFHGATVYLRGGEYSRQEIFTLNAIDSGTAEAPITYTNYLQEQPVLRGSQIITGWTPSPGNPNIYQADLTGQLADDFIINEVYFNAERQILARTPNYIPPDFTKSDPYEGTWKFTSLENDCATVPIDGRNRKTTLIYNQDDLSAPTLDSLTQSLTLSPSNPAQMEIYSNTEYLKNTINLSGLDSLNHQISLESDTSYEICAKNRYLLQNFFQALDANNEWYQDRTNNLLYFMPGRALTAEDRISVPFVTRAISLGAVQFTTFNGLTFEEFKSDIMVLNNTDHVSIFNNTMRSSRGQGIVIYSISHDININWNTFYDLGGNGIYVENSGSGLVYPKNLNSNNIKINNNTIHDVGYYDSGYGIRTIGTVGTVISHNEVYDLPRLGIMVYSNDNIVEYNKVYNVNLLTKDSGGIYVGSRSWLRRGNIIRNNYVKDTNGYGKYPWGNGDGSYRLGNFTSGIYLDDYSSGNFVYNNIVVNAQWGCFQNHLGRDNTYTNNICIEGGLGTSGNYGQMSLSEDTMVDPTTEPYIVSMWDELQNMTANGYDRDKYFGRYPELANIVAPFSTRQGEIMVNNKSDHNIFYFPESPNPITNSGYNIGANQQIDYNLYWPGARTISSKVTQKLDGNTVYISSWDGWKNLGFDLHSSIADPLFTNANVGKDNSMNFALKSNSPALALGFQPINTTQIGHPGSSSDLLVTITQNRSSVKSGQTITYTLTVQNSGGVTLSDISLTDPLSTKTKFLSADNGGTFNANSSTISWPAFDIEPDQTKIFTLKAKVL